jgi:hypothetical protein
VLEVEDFVNVNCHDDTWIWKGGHAFCTGKPTGVIRYREPLKNFEFTCEWMHKKKGGNSGLFVWATPKSINQLAAGKGRLPHGIEVQVLDLGYAEVYTKQHNKPADWFTSHGNVFPVGPVKMTPPETIDLTGHQLLGTWYYDSHSREITADGFCILRQGDELIWKRPCTSQSTTTLTFEGNLAHTLKGETLHIEGRYQAKKR